jgi:hypothetical protein
MSPEQFGETPHDLDERVDVYSLGVVLYEMLAGRPPYSLHKKPIHEIARIIRQQRPDPLAPSWKASWWAKSGDAALGDDPTSLTIPRGVDAIVQKCLRKDRRKRYSTAGELGAAIQKFLDDEQTRVLRKFTSGWLDGCLWLFAGMMRGPSESSTPAKWRTRGLLVLTLMSGLGVTSVWVVAQAITPPTRAQREAEEVRQGLLANFDACNREDLPDLMATISRQAPNRREFEQQAKALFESTDVYVGLAEFEILELRPPFASARVVQITLPADAEDRTKGNPREVFFRDRSGLLPKWEACEYTQTFRKENGKWKTHLITTEPRPVEANVQEERK